MPKTRRWNLNLIEGRYAATNLSETMVDLHFGVKHPDGRKEAIGRFRLDLPQLTRGGWVTRRDLGNGAVFDVQIYREPSGRFLLGVRRDRTTPLEAFAVS